MKNNNKLSVVFVLIILLFLTIGTKSVFAQTDLKGRILLQVESHGEAWYISPNDNKRYFLGRPDDAFNLMKKMGIGISNQNLSLMPKENEPARNNVFINKNLGKIFIQVEGKGEAWYVSPKDKKRYYLGRPKDAFDMMRKLGLGISNIDLSKIMQGNLYIPLPVQPPITTDKEVIYLAAEAIRKNDLEKTISYFTPEMKKAIEYTMDYLNAENKLALGNLLSSATLTSSSENQKTYSTEAYFSLGGYKVKLNYYLKKQADGNWLMSNL